MRILRNIVPAVIAAAVGLLPFVPGDAGAQGGNGTAFTYQGFLRDDGSPANGEFRMVFELLESGTPNPVAPAVIGPVEVTDGVFTAKLDFGPVFDGPPVELHILIDVGGQLIPLDPPQPICPTPLAVRAASAESADSVPDTALSNNVPIIVNNGISLPGADASLRFGPLGQCSIGIDPRFPGLVENDPVGFRLLGRDNQGCRLIFGPTMDCTVEIDPLGPPGLLLRDPSGIRIHPPEPGLPLLLFGPTDDCSLGIDPQFPGLVERDPVGFRLLGRDTQGCRLIFGPTMDCTVEIDPQGPPGLLLRDPSGIRIHPPEPGLPLLLFGPTDDCSLGIDPQFPGLVERDPVGFRLLGRDDQGCRLIFGPTMDCTVEIDPQGPMGLLLRDPKGVRLLPPDPLPGSPPIPPVLRFGPTDDCSIGLEPDLPGLAERDPTGFRLLGRDSQGCRLIFGPTMDCTVEIDPQGPSGLLLRDPKGVRILDPSGNGLPQLSFGPTDECRISVDPERGLLLRDPRGITIPFATGPAGELLPAILTMGDLGECRYRVNAPGTAKGMFLEDPAGLFLVNSQGAASALSFGETGECRLHVGEIPNGQNGLMFSDPNGVQFNTPESFFDVIIATEFVQASTRRLKDNIQPIGEAIEKIKQLEGVTFDWKPERGGKPSLGFIAEDVGKVFPQVVSYEEDGVNARGVNYGHLVAVTVEGIKQQQGQIETQQSEIESLRSENAALEQRLERLEKLMQQSSTKEADHERRL